MEQQQKTTQEQEKKEPVYKFQVGQVPKEYEPVIVDTDTEEVYTVLTALAKIMNDVNDLKKLL